MGDRNLGCSNAQKIDSSDGNKSRVPLSKLISIRSLSDAQFSTLPVIGDLMNYALIFPILIVLTTGTVCVGQTATQTRIHVPEGSPVGALRDKSSPVSETEVLTTLETEQKQRLAKLKRLTFDRRPSVILKAWSTPLAPAEESRSKPDGPPIDPPVKSDDDLPPLESPVKLDRIAEAAKAFDLTLKAFQRQVTLGDWDGVSQFLGGLSEDEAPVAYEQLLHSLANPSSRVTYDETNVFSVDDVFALVSLAPAEIESKLLLSLGAILRTSENNGNDLSHFLKRFQKLLELPDDQQKLNRRQISQLLFAASHPVEAGDFLPSPDEAIAENDREALNLLSTHFMAKYAEKQKVEFLEQAWHVTQEALSAGEINDEQKQAALKRAVQLAPKIKEELGQAWLEESFTTRPERGMEILATVGSAVATGLKTQAQNPTFRQLSLQLQRTAVEALLKSAPEKAQEWNSTLTLLASNWLREAVHTYRFDFSTSRGPRLDRDQFGNFFYRPFSSAAMSPMSSTRSSGSRNSRPQAIPTGKVLEVKPSDAWLALVDDSLRTKFTTIFPQLYLKVNEEENAFPYIETLANTKPERAKELAEEFLRVWTNNNDPNSSRRRTNIYMFSYGFNRRAQGIPLTRSKQQRSLRELATWVKRLRALPIGELDESVLTRAFTNTHSSAEVYRLEDLESVFGSVDSLKPDTLAEMIQKMRMNLAGLWRIPANQKDKNTNRKQKDIEAEVLRGYLVANAVLAKGIEKYPEHWAIQLAKAAIDHDQNGYAQELKRDSGFTERRANAFDGFEKSAKTYASGVEKLEEQEQTAKVFETWFYASMGAVDLARINGEKQPDLRQPELIREAILALPGEAADRHMGMFANSLFTRLSSVKPEVKFRFLRSGFKVVGDHERADEARKVFDYYKDLVSEIKLETVIDGSDVVGHREPFGVFINLRHTKQIERESGGFSRYLQNQNNQSYAYNYGRPTENYRDRFEEAAKEALEEHFEVLSVTFEDPEVTSRATEEDGWRITPYAYMLLKPRGPEVDTIPSVQLDLDFLDTSGYAVIPIETAPMPIDAQPEIGKTRPIADVVITQTLDERQSSDGKLMLEVKATARGLVPSLDQLLDVSPQGFKVTNTDDQGVSVSKFDKEGEGSAVISERIWMISMAADEDLATPATTFTFASSRVEDASVTYQRFIDADLASVEQLISLERAYGEARNPWLMWLTGAAIVIVGLVLVLRLSRHQRRNEDQAVFTRPESVTPFTVLGLLKDIERNNGMNKASLQELTTSINRLETYYFHGHSADGNSNAPDLDGVLDEWIRRTTIQAS